jgi:hypothetical protein
MRAWRVVVVLALLAGGTWWLLRPGEPRRRRLPRRAGGRACARGRPPPSLAPSPGRATPPAAMADGVADGSAHERVDPTDGSAPAAVAGPRARLEGTVLDDAGRPVAGARVRAMAVQDDATAAKRRSPRRGTLPSAAPTAASPSRSSPRAPGTPWRHTVPCMRPAPRPPCPCPPTAR